MPDEEICHFYRKAEEELALAQKAELPEIVAIHYQLACAYLDRLTEQECAPPSAS